MNKKQLTDPCKHGHIGQRSAAHDGRCLECVKRDGKKTREKSKERTLQRNRERYARLKKEGKQRRATPDETRKKYEKNKEKHLLRRADYRRRNRAQYACYKRNRDARLRDGGAHSIEDVEDIIRLQRGKCAYCRTALKHVSVHVDHVRPIAKGGTNLRSNLQVLCQTCNLNKSDIDPIEFAQRIGRLV